MTEADALELYTAIGLNSLCRPYADLFTLTWAHITAMHILALETA